MEKSPSGKTISLCAMPKDIDRFPTLCSEVTCDGNLAVKGVHRSQRIVQGETNGCIIRVAGSRKWNSSLEAKLDGFSAGN
jgi:hypothetical protein